MTAWHVLRIILLLQGTDFVRRSSPSIMFPAFDTSPSIDALLDTFDFRRHEFTISRYLNAYLSSTDTTTMDTPTMPLNRLIDDTRPLPSSTSLVRYITHDHRSPPLQPQPRSQSIPSLVIRRRLERTTTQVDFYFCNHEEGKQRSLT